MPKGELVRRVSLSDDLVLEPDGDVVSSLLPGFHVPPSTPTSNSGGNISRPLSVF